MSNSAKVISILLAFVLGLAAFVGVCYVWVPGIRVAINMQRHAVQKADDATSYKTRKAVEDTARAMIASYEADLLSYDLYKGSEDAEKRGWAEQARMRANKTASVYNAYLLENSYVWSDNIPADIQHELAVLTD